MKPIIGFVAMFLALQVMAAELVFDTTFDKVEKNGLPTGWSLYGSGTPVQVKDGRMLFINTDPKRSSGIVRKFDMEAGFEYEISVEAVEKNSGENVDELLLQLNSANETSGKMLCKCGVSTGNLGQYVTSTLKYIPQRAHSVALYLSSKQGSAPQVNVRRILCQRGLDARKWMPANQPPFTVFGLPFLKENNGAYYRYPEVRMKQLPTWGMTCYPSGARIRFKTNATRIDLRIDHGKGSFPWPEMSALSMACIDIYQGPPEAMVFTWRTDRNLLDKDFPYCASYCPKVKPGEMCEYTLYLPMYASLKSLDIALTPADAKVENPAPYKLAKPVVWYSTSFAQGAGASGPSMSFPALTARILGVDLVNFGISGNAQWLPEEARLIAEIDAAVYIMGPILGNAKSMAERYPAMIRILREKHPDTPILLVTRLHTLGVDKPHEVNEMVKKLYADRVSSGDKNIYLIDAFLLYSDGPIPCTIDGVHVTDLGAKMIADAFVPELKKILNLK
ncbi:MAG: SGNH/GDSL hydrolase family protein [Kiritimatiellae bacterium]|nr:SGNH/GDSL hydrolase family protein [Kiritimatiellia bacterium]MDD5519912.1 SGNH/GDSL hydrolase family protein [Kiritimatiellia bacterium]